MNFFTRDLIERGQSDKARVARAARLQWEKAVVRYRRRWEKIRGAFPLAARRFHDEHAYLHNAELLGMGREGDQFILLLQPEPPAPSLAILTFTLDGLPSIDTQALPQRNGCGRVTWLCEEFDLDRQKRCGFEVLFSNGWSVKLRFRDLQYQIAQRLYPVANLAPLEQTGLKPQAGIRTEPCTQGNGERSGPGSPRRPRRAGASTSRRQRAPGTRTPSAR
jgi:hypothetical protein